MLTFSSALFFISVDFLFYQKHSRPNQVSILCQSRLFLLPLAAPSLWESEPSIHPLSIEAISPTRPPKQRQPARFLVSILCQSRLFLLPSKAKPWPPSLRQYPSSVNRGYFSYGCDWSCPQSQPCRYPSSVNRGYFSYAPVWEARLIFSRSIHPLSIEAISPTHQSACVGGASYFVSILCQSRLFLLQVWLWQRHYPSSSIHPLSIEAISPTSAATTVFVAEDSSIHPLSIEAISPTHNRDRNAHANAEYPSSVNRGYFSYGWPRHTPTQSTRRIHPLSIEAISPT